jgi:hypothetical protein
LVEIEHGSDFAENQEAQSQDLQADHTVPMFPVWNIPPMFPLSLHLSTSDSIPSAPDVETGGDSDGDHDFDGGGDGAAFEKLDDRDLDEGAGADFGYGDYRYGGDY